MEGERRREGWKEGGKEGRKRDLPWKVYTEPMLAVWVLYHLCDHSVVLVCGSIDQ